MNARYVVMGVSGCGKSRIGAAFATAIGARFIDGDSLHPKTNIEKMSRGEPLTDADRAPWLDQVGQALGPQTVIACSALKRCYRDRIRDEAGTAVVFLFLQGPRDVLLERMNNRPGHFMPASLLDSQFAALEPPDTDEMHITADIQGSPEQIVQDLVLATKELNT